MMKKDINKDVSVIYHGERVSRGEGFEESVCCAGACVSS
jgi:hypothetical protein